MKLSEVCRETGLQKRTVRFYVDAGLVQPRSYEKSGRTYKEYTHEDVRRLEAVASLRRARFSLAQIRRMLDDPGSIPEVYGQYLGELKELSRQTAELLEAARELDISQVSDAGALGKALEPESRKLGLPQRDLSPPRFGRLDSPEFAESSRATEFHRNQYRNRPRAPVILNGRADPKTGVYLAVMQSDALYRPKTKSGRRWLILIVAAVAAALIVGAALSYAAYQRDMDGPVMYHGGSEYVGQRLTTQNLPYWAVKAGVLEYMEESESPGADGFYTYEDYLRGSNVGSVVEDHDLEVWAVDNAGKKFYVCIPPSGYREPEYMVFRKK